jgi:hypothetical protein
MPREPQGLQQAAATTMTILQKSVIPCVALLLCASAANLHAQAEGKKGGASCFAVHVRLNGKVVDGPQTVTFKTKENEATARLEGGCFRVPPAVLNDKDVDVLFTVPRNKVYLSMIPTRFLAGSWDIDLEDERFGTDVVLPKHARTKETCVVVFRVGEPETVRALTGCRMPL